MRLLLPFACTAALLAACSSSDDVLPPAKVTFLGGQEMDTWDGPPVPTSVKVELVQVADGTRSTLTTVPAPATEAILPAQHMTQPVVGRFEMTATDSAGATAVRGSSVPFLIYDIEDYVIPLFVARIDGWARPPTDLVGGRVHPVTVQVQEYVLAAGGDPLAGVDPALPDIYDAALWRTLKPGAGQPVLPRVPKSMAVIGVTLLMVDDAGATWLDLSASDAVKVAAPAPTGLTFAEVAGGTTVMLPDGTQFIIGGTRPTGEATAKVLKINLKGELEALSLTTPRLGAAATVVGTTLVVAGGNGDGAWAETSNANVTAFVPLAITATPTEGLGIASLDATTAIVAGGKEPASGTTSPVRSFDVTCTSSCTTTDVAVLPKTLSRTRVFGLGGSRVIALGETDDGENVAFLIDTSISPATVTEKVLRQPRKGATPFLLPNDQPALMGGTTVDSGEPVLSIEAFFK